MPRSSLENAIQQAAAEFALTIVAAVKGATLTELMELQSGASPKRRGRKPGPKAKNKSARAKPGPKPKRKPGRPPGAKTKRKPGRPPGSKNVKKLKAV